MTKIESSKGEKRRVRTPEEWGRIYGERYSFYEDFTTKLRDLLEELLDSEGLEPSQIEARTKSIESFVDKIQKKEKYGDPLVDITDLVGIRIISYYDEDVDRTQALLKREFEIDKENSIDKSESLDPDRFGYLSIHFVVSLSLPRKELSEWRKFSGIKAEIQVRTVLQHAWAAIDHKLRYKNTTEVPRPLRRQLFRLSALLELADSEFSDLRRRTDVINKHYTSEVKRGELDIEINLDSLGAYFQSKKVLGRWIELAEQLGYQSVNTLPPDQIEQSREYARSRLLKILSHSNIRKMGELDDILNEALSWGKEGLTKICQSITEKGYVPCANDADVITFVVFYANKEKIPIEIIEELDYNNEIKSALLELATESRKAKT